MIWLVVAFSIATLVFGVLGDQRALRYGQRVGGHRPPDPAPTLLEAAQEAYVAGRLDVAQLDRRVGYLLERGLADRREPIDPPLRDWLDPELYGSP